MYSTRTDTSTRYKYCTRTVATYGAVLVPLTPARTRTRNAEGYEGLFRRMVRDCLRTATSADDPDIKYGSGTG